MLQDKHVAALRSGFCLASAFSFLAGAHAAEHQLATKSNDPKVAVASDEGENAIKGFVPQPGFKVELFAAEPHLANPVAFSIDNQNHFYVVETFRLHAGVTDIRGIMPWLDEDLAARTVEDRLAEMKRHLGDKYADYSKETDRVKRIEDRNGDGKADFSTVFADGFNHPADGLAAGVLARKGDVWFANIPHLWLLKDTNNDGVADTRKSLHYGFGVRAGFLGHDLHGLRFGPDGKIYFSIGDRGANIQVGDKRLGHPDCGSVFRCYPDGSELEEVAFGLRNPQELAFDDHGNLFTGDNNSDGGDKARWVYVVEGGDSGWRIGYQFLENPNARGPWNAEKLWHPQWDGQAAYLLPPIANVTDGPSGLAYYPGTGLPDRYQGHFFLCDFHGGKGSGIVSFGLKPNGATFELTDKHNFIWEVLPTDVEFGVDGGIYYSDWVRGWNMTGKGRIYHIYQPEAQKQPVVAETKRLLMEGMEKRSLKELAGLLAHRNQRVRQEAQFELADRGSASLKTLAEVARKNPNQLARLHAIWGLGQIDARFKLTGTKPGLPAALEPLLPLLADSDAEVRGQAAKLAGDRHLDLAYDSLLKLLRDPAPRARFFAAHALGKLGRREALPAILTMIRENADQDRYLRHAGVMALTGIGDFPAILAAAKDSSPAVRMAALLALRRLERSEISLFLQDSNPALVLEAARAINDVPISGAMPELAAVLDRSDLSEWLARRAINANLRANTAETAQALASYAAKSAAPANLRAEAINTLADWPKASGRDRVTGMWRPVASAREAKHPADALRPAITELLRQAPDAVRVAAVQAADRLQLTEALAALRDIAGDQKAGANVRVAALRALAGLSDEKLPDYLNVAGSDGSSEVRQEALRLSARVKPSGAVAKLSAALADGSIQEKQSALATLGSMADPAADNLLGEWLVRLLADKVPGELKLDLLEAAAKRNQPALKEKLEAYESRRSKDDALAGYREVLSGGNAEAGKKIFLERADVACVKCHKAGGEGGEVGPNLAGVATRQNREYLLESVVLPNKKIAAGFETLIVVQKEGPAYAGVLKSENDKEIVINSPEDGLVTVKKSDIKRRERGQSGMPEGMGTVLTKVELRDLIEFLGSLK